MAPLTWRHHTLIQALLSRGLLKDNQFHTLFYQLTGKTPDHRVFNDFLSDINAELNLLELDLKKYLNQYNGKAYYGVANNVADDQSKLGTKYIVPQIALYKGIIEAIVQDSNGEGSISNNETVHLDIQISNGTGSESQGNNTQTQIPTALRNFTISQKGKVIEEFVWDQWLWSISDGHWIDLGVRSFLDLKSWFDNNDVANCEVCNEAAIKVHTFLMLILRCLHCVTDYEFLDLFLVECCPNENCPARIHPSCLKKKFKQAKANKVCPKCSTK